MRILSIDIGIKHLAFCLFGLTDTSEYNIERWDIINLCNEEKHQCSCVNAKKKPCIRTPRYSKNNLYYCKIHAKKQKYKIPLQEYKLSILNKTKLSQLKKIYENMDGPNIKKIKKNECLNYILTYLDEYYLNFIIVPKASEFKIATLGQNIRIQFKKLLDGINLDRVIVENQIGPLANRMKMLQGMVMQHFIELGVPIIEEISPANKLKNFLQSKQKTTYNERKKLGIQVTRDKIMNTHNLTPWQDFFLKHKKKDDLADSFLQGLWYLRKFQLIK